MRTGWRAHFGSFFVSLGSLSPKQPKHGHFGTDVESSGNSMIWRTLRGNGFERIPLGRSEPGSNRLVHCVCLGRTADLSCEAGWSWTLSGIRGSPLQRSAEIPCLGLLEQAVGRQSVAALPGAADCLAVRWAEAAVKVGDGRGFIVDREGERLILTAAHCLPELPSCHPARGLGECTYIDLVGALDAEPTIFAECRFAELIADIAILGAPDGQELYTKAQAYEALVAARAEVFMIGPTRRLDPL